MARRRRPDSEVRRDHWVVAGIGAAAIGFGVFLMVELPASVAPSFLPGLAGGLRAMTQVTVMVLLIAGLAAIGWAVWHPRRYFSAEQRFRRELGDPEGWLDRLDYDTVAGPEALRRKGEEVEPHTRPGPGQAPPPIIRYGWSPGELVSGSRTMRGKAVFCPWCRGTLLLGPPGSGKTQLLFHPVLDAPGAAVVGSTKPELAEQTMALRALLGPVAVFNPSALGELLNTMCWDPVSGCWAESVADRRAWALVRGAGGAEGIHRPGFWARKAAETLRYYLMAAALEGLDMTAVMHWANNPDADPTPQTILDEHPDTPAGWNSGLRAILRTVKETRDGYFATVTSAVAFMDSEPVRQACRRSRGTHSIDDVAAWLAARGTIYMIGSDDDTRLAPLFTALTDHIFFEAKRIAAGFPKGALPVPLTLLLDEVAHMTPVPLDEWSGYARGLGVTLIPVIQSLAQLDRTWGHHEAKIIWDNLPVKLALPGITDRDTLETLSYLAGTRRVREVTEGTNHHGGGLGTSTSTRITEEPVITGQAIGAMPPSHMFALGLARHPAVLRYEPGRERVARENAGLLGGDPGDGPTDTPWWMTRPGERR